MIDIDIKMAPADIVVGTRVRGHILGDKRAGTVIGYGSSKDALAIRFDENVYGHDCSSARDDIGNRPTCEYGHGWFVPRNHVEVIG